MKVTLYKSGEWEVVITGDSKEKVIQTLTDEYMTEANSNGLESDDFTMVRIGNRWEVDGINGLNELCGCGPFERTREIFLKLVYDWGDWEDDDLPSN